MPYLSTIVACARRYSWLSCFFGHTFTLSLRMPRKETSNRKSKMSLKTTKAVAPTTQQHLLKPVQTSKSQATKKLQKSCSNRNTWHHILQLNKITSWLLKSQRKRGNKVSIRKCGRMRSHRDKPSRLKQIGCKRTLFWCGSSGCAICNWLHRFGSMLTTWVVWMTNYRLKCGSAFLCTRAIEMQIWWILQKTLVILFCHKNSKLLSNRVTSSSWKLECLILHGWSTLVRTFITE